MTIVVPLATEALEDLVTRVAVRRCPQEKLFQSLRDVMRDFCQFSRIWKYTVQEAAIAVGNPTVTLLVPTYAQAIAADLVQVDDAKPAVPRTVQYFDNAQPAWRTQLGDSYAEYTQETPGTIRFPAVPIVGTSDGLTYRVDVKPTVDAQTAPAFLVDEWLEDLAAGARGKLLMMEREEWSHAVDGAKAWAQYIGARGRARIRANQQYGATDQIVRGKYKFAGK